MPAHPSARLEELEHSPAGDDPHLDADQTFRTGLDYLLDGIEARVLSDAVGL